MSRFRWFSKRAATPPESVANAVGAGRSELAQTATEVAERMPPAVQETSPPPTATRPEPEPATPRERLVRDAVRAWTAELADLGGPNNLLWKSDSGTVVLDLTRAHPGGLTRLFTGAPTRLDDLFREPAAHRAATALAARIADKDTELSTERGLSACFLAIGEATWPVARSGRTAAAPVMLRPCRLTLGPGAAGETQVEIEDDTILNPALVQYLASAHQVSIDPRALVAQAWATGLFDPRPVYAALAGATAAIEGFTVADDARVGTYTTTKAAMVADLSAFTDLAANDLVAALAGHPDAISSLAHGQPPAAVLEAARQGLVVEADADQLAALADVRHGTSLVIDAPPGTGATQTIANLIAASAGSGQRLALVAQRPGAIADLRARLAEVGLDDLVLELRDGVATSRDLAAQLVHSIDAAHQSEQPDADRVSNAAHAAAEDELAQHAAAMHTPREPWGVSAHAIIQEVARLTALPSGPRTRVRLDGAALAAMPRTKALELGARLHELARLGAWSETGEDDPWFGSNLVDEAEADRASDIVLGLAEGRLDTVQSVVDTVFEGIQLPTMPTVAAWGRLIDTVSSVRDTLETFRPDIFDIPLTEIVAATAPNDRQENELSWWARRRLRRQARSLLRPGVPPPDLHAALLTAHHQRSAWRDLAGPGGRPEIPAELDRAQSAYSALADDLAWLDSRVPDGSGIRLINKPRAELTARIAALAASTERARVVPHVREGLEAVRAAGLGPLVDDLAARGVLADAVPDEVKLLWWGSLAEQQVLTDARMTTLSGDELRTRAVEFATTDAAMLRGQARLVRSLIRQRSRAALAADPAAETAIRAAAEPDAPAVAVAHLLAAHGDVILALRPCLAVSPLLIGALVPPTTRLDLIIVEEASQVPTAAVISAVARARQLVVVGDPQFLAPSGFATGATARDRSELVAREGELPDSVLSTAVHILAVRELSQHYRAMDERLLALANETFYDGRLRGLPGVDVASPVHFTHIDGEGMPREGAGAVETTAAEVDEVVRQVLAHAAHSPDQSLGVVTLSTAHAERIQRALNRSLASATPEVARALTPAGPNGFFIAPMDRVSAEVRDHIVLAVGFGKTPHGRVLNQFGLLSDPSGERHLAVALTRARRQLTVISSLMAADLEPSRLRSEGGRLLRAVLERLPELSRQGPTVSAGALDPLMRQLAERLRAAGLVVHERVGASDPIDVVVQHPQDPSRLALAIVGDGAAYAARPTVRDRDRLRAQTLSAMGWTPAQVWSMEFYRDPAREVARLLALVPGMPS